MLPLFRVRPLGHRDVTRQTIPGRNLHMNTVGPLKNISVCKLFGENRCSGNVCERCNVLQRFAASIGGGNCFGSLNLSANALMTLTDRREFERLHKMQTEYLIIFGNR